MNDLHGYSWPAKKRRWNQTHYNWLEAIKFEQHFLQVVLQEYIDAVKAATQRVTGMTDQVLLYPLTPEYVEVCLQVPDGTSRHS